MTKGILRISNQNTSFVSFFEKTEESLHSVSGMIHAYGAYEKVHVLYKVLLELQRICQLYICNCTTEVCKTTAPFNVRQIYFSKIRFADERYVSYLFLMWSPKLNYIIHTWNY